MSLRNLKTFLTTTTVINSQTYVDILNAAPSSLVGKLRLVPDKHLSGRLAHLLVVANIEDMTEDLGFEYECLSVENVDTDLFMIDHDAIVRNLSTGKVVIVDCTSNPGLIAVKTGVLRSKVVESPHIDTYLVHVFAAKKFEIIIQRPRELMATNSGVFDLFDTISARSADWKDTFFATCIEIYNIVCSDILTMERDELKDRYKAWIVSTDTLSMSRSLVQSHTDKDAIFFREVSANSPVPIYLETYKEILRRQRPVKSPCMNQPAALNKSTELASILRSLSSNVIADSLCYAMRNKGKWIGTTDIGQHRVISAPCSKKVLPNSSIFQVCVKHVEGHLFDIKFRPDTVDSNFNQLMCDAPKLKGTTKLYSEDVVDAHREMLKDYIVYTKEFMESGSSAVSNSFLGKLTTLANEYIRTSVEITKHACSMTSSIASFMNETSVGDMINHDYEVAKSFSASLKGSAKVDRYYIGINGPYNSVTLTRLSSTQDSFNTAAYFIIYQRANARDYTSVRAYHRVDDDIIQGRTRTFNRNSLAHALRLPAIIISLMTWELEHLAGVSSTVTKKTLMQVAVNSALHASVNSDQFSQCAEQIRYLFTSNVGFGASSSDICDKVSFIRTGSLWEQLYLFRMLKLACGLNVIFKSRNIATIIRDKEFSVMFPNSVAPTRSFSHLVSSMYYANVYNKFRAFHEISEAICYNELDNEDAIFRKAVSENREFVQGIQDRTMLQLMSDDPINVDEVIQREVDFCRTLVATGPGRFKSSLLFIIGATASVTSVGDDDITNLYKILNTAPIEACTMKGGTESGVSKLAHQGIRAASAMLEELIDEFGMKRELVNKSKMEAAWFLHKVSESNFDFSILSAVSRQFIFKEHYRYRIVQKDQKGHREISVLNAKFRLGALLCEKIAKEMSTLIPSDVLDNPSKDVLVENVVRNNIRDSSNTFVISDNSDQKRWGPNHLLHSFSAMYFALLRRDPGLFRIVNLALHYGECKRAKFPETLVDLSIKVKFRSNSEPIKQFFSSHRKDVESGCLERQFDWGMCQGIFHRTSSLYHGIMCAAVNNVCKRIEGFPDHSLNSFVTSDDAERIFCFKESVADRISVCRRLHSMVQNVGTVMNILRNESKSVFSSHITEFNSIFYHNGYLATPTLKQRISKIDIGDGHDPILDYLTATSLSMGYFQNGGSYSGAVTLMLINIALHTEQWRRWKIIQDGFFDRPVEFGGFPAIEPLTLMYCGPISLMYLRSKSYADARTFSYMITKSTVLPAQEVKLEDYHRRLKPPDSEDDLTVYKSAGPMGILSLSRTDRRLSQFERRHKMSKWFALDQFVTLNNNAPYAGKFIFNLMRITKTCTFETSLGVNSFYIRFTDPWVNNNRKCLRYHNNSYFVKELIKPIGNALASPSEYMNILLSVADSQILKFYDDAKMNSINDAETDRMGSRLRSLMEDADIIYNTLYKIYEIRIVEATNKNSIVKLNLSAAGPIDEDEFHLSLLKSVIGDRIKSAVIRKTGNPSVWSRIPVIANLPVMEPLEGIYHCSSIIELYNRFVRRSTKLICPGDSKPADISELLKKILSNKYTEMHGIKTVDFPELVSSKLPGILYRAHNNDLMDHSLSFWRSKEVNIDVRRNYMPMRTGIDTEREVLTNFDDFKLSSTDATMKTVEIKAKSKFGFIQKIRMWSSAKVEIILSSDTRQSLLQNRFTNLHEYCVDNDMYVKNQTGLSMSVYHERKRCFEIQHCDTSRTAGDYIHHFFVDSNALFITVEATVENGDMGKPWAANLATYINSLKRFKTNVYYDVKDDRGRVRDKLMFVATGDVDRFSIETFPNNLSIFLRHLRSNILIPVCSQVLGELTNIHLGISYKPSDFVAALEVFNSIFGNTNVVTDMSDELKEYMRTLLFRTSIHTEPSVLNSCSRRGRLKFHLPTKESIDILRACIICTVTRDLRGDRVRIQHYFLNLFRSSPYYNNGVTSIKFDEIMLDDPDINVELDREDSEELVDLGIPEAPQWRGFDSDDTLVPSASLIVAPNVDYNSLFEMDMPFTEEEMFNEDAAVETDIINAMFGGTAETTDVAPSIIAGMETRDTHIIGRHFEESYSMVQSIKALGKSLVPKLKPIKTYFTPTTFVQTMQSLITASAWDHRNAPKALSEMYSGTCPLYNISYPLSAICISELNF